MTGKELGIRSHASWVAWTPPCMRLCPLPPLHWAPRLLYRVPQTPHLEPPFPNQLKTLLRSSLGEFQFPLLLQLRPFLLFLSHFFSSVTYTYLEIFILLYNRAPKCQLLKWTIKVKQFHLVLGNNRFSEIIRLAFLWNKSIKTFASTSCNIPNLIWFLYFRRSKIQVQS